RYSRGRSSQSLPKARAPAGIYRLPAQSCFRLGVQGTARLGHHQPPGVPDQHAAKPLRHAARQLRSDGAGKLRQPNGYLGWFVVDHVENTADAAFEGPEGGMSGIIDVDE